MTFSYEVDDDLYRAVHSFRRISTVCLCFSNEVLTIMEYTINTVKEQTAQGNNPGYIHRSASM